MTEQDGHLTWDIKALLYHVKAGIELAKEQFDIESLSIDTWAVKASRMLIDISGYARQDYLLDRALQEEITVHPNSWVQHFLEKYLVQILGELQRLKSTTADEPCLPKPKSLVKVISKLS